MTTSSFPIDPASQRREFDALTKLGARDGNMIARGRVWFVDSSATGAADALTNYNGQSFTRPFKTIDYAIGQCRANKGDVILVSENHSETITTASAIDCDVDGISIIGLSKGYIRPKITFAHANATIEVAANCTCYWKGFEFKAEGTGTLAVTMAVNMAAATSYAVFLDIRFTSGTSDSFTAKLGGTGVANGRLYEFPTDATEAELAAVVGAMDDAAATGDVTTEDTAMAYIKQLVTQLLATDIVVDSVLEDTGTTLPATLLALGTNDANNAFDSSTVVSNADGSILERLEYLQASDIVATAKDPVTVSKETMALPASTQGAAFTIAGGLVKILQIVGQVTTVVQDQACNLKLIANPASGNDQDICAAVSVQALAAGSLLGITGFLADAMTTGTSLSGQARSVIANTGTIDVHTTATNTGAITWTVTYIPITAGATITAAA